MKKTYLLIMILLVGIPFACKKDVEPDRDKNDPASGSSQLLNPFPDNVVFEVNDPLNGSTVQSPSILVLPNGDYLVSFFYDRGTNVYISEDKGKTWEAHARIAPSNFATLFEHRGDVYLMGTSMAGRGDVTIYKSTDQGKTWSTPTDESSGILFKGMFHTSPVPVVKYNGRIWRAYEEIFDSPDSRDFYAFAVSADENADLLKASSWKRTNSIRFDESWINAQHPNWLEGNIVITPEGKLINFLRLETWSGSGISYEITGAAQGKPRNEIAAVIDINEQDMTVEFRNKARSFVHFPGSETKFTIRYDPVSEKYWTITNKITSFRNTTGTHGGNWHQRNVLVLMSSADLVDWRVDRKILRWNEGAHLWTWDTFGFQYVDWVFENNDIILVSRTSWYGRRYHDANMITFHRVENFRTSNNQEPEDWLKYTEHPKLFDISAEAIASGQLTFGDFEVTLLFGDGVVQNDQGEISLKNQFVSTDEKQAMLAHRYLDIIVKSDKIADFSIEKLSASAKGNNRNFRLKWMYSTDGVTFYPITNYLQRVEGSTEGINYDPPLYLRVYRPLNKISGKDGAILRCVFVRGDGSGTYMKFDDVISVGGRSL